VVLATTSTLTLTLGVIAPTLSVFVGVAQATRVVRSGAQGVSLLTWILSMFVASTWAIYGFAFHVPAELYCNFPFVAICFLVIFIATRHQQRERITAWQCGGVLVAIALVATTGFSVHWRWIISTVAVGSAILIYLPQLVVSLKSKDLQGVSVVSWATALVTSLIWGIYGLLLHKTPVSIPSVVMVPSSLIILIQVSRHRLNGHALSGTPSPLN
jgi:MtN3 and saliva related transmembrane protein